MNLPRTSVVSALSILPVVLAGPVDAAAPPGQYVLSASGDSVYDTKSRLTWQKGGYIGTWADAKTYCAGLGSTLGGTGWRLPTFKELLTLLDLSQPGITSIDFKIDSALAPTVDTGYWSTTLVAGDQTKAWNVNFFYGDTYPFDVTRVNATRCVR